MQKRLKTLEKVIKELPFEVLILREEIASLNNGISGSPDMTRADINQQIKNATNEEERDRETTGCSRKRKGQNEKLNFPAIESREHA